MNLDNFDTVLIETAGGLAPLQDLGQDATVAVLAVSGGDDKAAEYHRLLSAASAVLLTKMDLQPFIKFDATTFRNDLRSINGHADIHELSASSGAGMDEWITWIDRQGDSKRHRRTEPSRSPSDVYFG